MLRISVESDQYYSTLRIEGKLVGPWTAELDRTWNEVKSTLGTRPLRLDLCGLLFVDERGKTILRGICRETKTEILCNTPLTRHFAEEAKRESLTEVWQGEDDAERESH